MPFLAVLSAVGTIWTVATIPANMDQLNVYTGDSMEPTAIEQSYVPPSPHYPAPSVWELAHTNPDSPGLPHNYWNTDNDASTASPDPADGNIPPNWHRQPGE